MKIRQLCVNFIRQLSFDGRLFGATQVSRYLKGKTNQDFTDARDIEWQWYQLDHIKVCISLQTDNTQTPNY